MMPTSSLIPERMRVSLERYVKTHTPVGDFLTAVLENNLREAVGRADEENLEALPHTVAWCYNELPSVCWGSPERVAAWLKVAPEGTLPDSFFRKLDATEEAQFRGAARDAYKAGEPINGLYHPVYRDECRKINAEVKMNIDKNSPEYIRTATDFQDDP